MDEQVILNQLPSCLKADLQYFRYSKLISKSMFFRTFYASTNVSLTSSIIKLMDYDIFLPDEPILVGGFMCTKIYILLEGSAEALNMDLNEVTQFLPGDSFGALIGPHRYPAHIIAQFLFI